MLVPQRPKIRERRTWQKRSSFLESGSYAKQNTEKHFTVISLCIADEIDGTQAFRVRWQNFICDKLHKQAALMRLSQRFSSFEACTSLITFVTRDKILRLRHLSTKSSYRLPQAVLPKSEDRLCEPVCFKYDLS